MSLLRSERASWAGLRPLTLHNGRRRDIADLGEHQITRELDVVVVRETADDNVEEGAQVELVQAGIKEGVHGLVGSLCRCARDAQDELQM